ncbi:hypothetical protein KY360_04760 [Candidatus Woesearchaeota archaeon]|nr:hypothetical protein [Candidatus Woesearchaeota archaeon]
MPKNWKKEIARDAIALGSIPFYFIVIVRAVIGKFAPFVIQLFVALFVLFILSFLIKNSDPHVARSLILIFFTSIFYDAGLYTLFAVFLWGMIILSSLYLKVKGREVSKGVLLGAVSSAASYYITSLFV